MWHQVDCFGDEDSKGTSSVREKIRSLERTVALLPSPKLTAFNAIVDLVRETLSPEIRVSMGFPQKKGRGDYAGLYELVQ